MRRTLKTIPFALTLLLGLSAPSLAAEPADDDAWSAYLDYAYVYSSANAEALQARLAQYGKEAGVSLEDYIQRELVPTEGSENEVQTRRRSIALLLQYLATSDPDALESSVDGIRELKGRLDRHENRYWYHYILAHSALERGRPHDFVSEVLRLWLRVDLPLEAPYEMLAALSLSESPNSGFVAALPYVQENIARIVLIRSQEKGINYGLDPLAAIMRMLHDERVGMYADVIPSEASSSDYLDRIVHRLDGPESDGGSLTFTLALFEAAKNHDKARSLLATEGLAPETVEAMRIAAASYEAALKSSETAQGKTAVYSRVLRLLGEVYVARQRLAVDVDLETSFSIEGAMSAYASLEGLGEEGWNAIPGSQSESYTDAMRGLWAEIQEACLNAADFYLARSVTDPARSDEHAKSAARIYSRYLAFFQRYTEKEQSEGVPESAYFAAYEAARGFGDSFMAYSAKPSPTQVELATRRYRSALHLFPFDPRLWPALTEALERHGRENEYMTLAAPVADFVAGSRSIHNWIAQREASWKEISTLRRALADTQVIMLLGFGGAQGLTDLEGQLTTLRGQRGEVHAKLTGLAAKRSAPGADAPPASPAPGMPSAREVLDRPGRERLERRIHETTAALNRLDRQIEAAERALPLYRATQQVDGLIADLRTQRDHPVHTLLRRMYRESQGQN
jgi:hypothetical protein